MASEAKEESNSAPSDVENVTADEEMEDASSKLKDGDKEKNETKEESDKEGSDDENEDDDEDEEVALLDRPVMMTGCRARKKVERLEVSFSTPKEKQEFPEGKGKKLGECPRIEAQIQKMKVVDLKPLHKVLFNRIGSANEIKKNLRKFCGFPFDKDSVEYTRKKASTEKMTAPVLKQICLILDIERSGSKEEIVNRILTFLLNPEDSGKKVPSAKKRASKDKKKSTSKKAKAEKKGKVEKNDKSDEEPDKSEEDDDDDDDDDEDEDDDSAGGGTSMGGTDEEANQELVGDDSKKKPKEKASKAKSKADKGKKEEKKTKGTKRKQDEIKDDDSSASSSDEQPPAKKSKMPSNEEITKLIKQILESADLQEITMKKVIKQVSDAYPDHDLTNKKAFIKSTIKSVIS